MRIINIRHSAKGHSAKELLAEKLSYRGRHGVRFDLSIRQKLLSEAEDKLIGTSRVLFLLLAGGRSPISMVLTHLSRRSLIVKFPPAKKEVEALQVEESPPLFELSYSDSLKSIGSEGALWKELNGNPLYQSQ